MSSTERPSGARARPHDRLLIAGNWKMNGSLAQARALSAAALRSATEAPEVEVALFPAHPLLPAVAEVLRAPGGPVSLGGQGCHWEPKGAHTSSVAASMLAEAGCAYVLCGHSEVRRELGYDDVRVRGAVERAMEAGLRPVLCVGETGEERTAGLARDVVVRQTEAALRGLADVLERVDLAYEPVWAIGTGRHATAEQAGEAHRWIRETLLSVGGAPPGGGPPPTPASRPARRGQSRILYGGSVSPANIVGFLSQPGVDGVLVGGQSLEASAFAALVASARTAAGRWRRS